MKLFSEGIIPLLIFALVIRIAISFWSFGFRENTDILRWRDWARITHLYGFADTYKPDFISFGTLPNNMPPGTLYIVSTLYELNVIFAKITFRITDGLPEDFQWINGPLLIFFLKFPSMIADLVIGVLIYLFTKEKLRKQSTLIGTSLFLFNPVIIYNSSFWGQMDSINNLFFILSLYFLYKKRAEFVLPFFFLSLFVKLSLFPLLPLLILFLVLQNMKEIKKVFISALFSFLMLILLILPVSKAPWNWLISYLSFNSLGEMQNVTAFAFNFWWALFRPSISIGNPDNLFSFSEIRLINSPHDSSIYFSLSLFAWAMILFILFLVPLFYLIIKKHNYILRADNLFLVFSIGALLVFLFLPRMHERYLYPVFPLLAIYLSLKQKFILQYIILSVCSFINVYIVWHPMKIPILPFEIISNTNFQWSTALIILATSLILYAKSIKSLRHEKNI